MRLTHAHGTRTRTITHTHTAHRPATPRCTGRSASLRGVTGEGHLHGHWAFMPNKSGGPFSATYTLS